MFSPFFLFVFVLSLSLSPQFNSGECLRGSSGGGGGGGCNHHQQKQQQQFVRSISVLSFVAFFASATEERISSGLACLR